MNGMFPAKRTGGPCVKASNLVPGTTGATLKEALQTWGVTGIEEVAMSEGRFGPIAVMRFKTEAEAELMMMANGVQVEGMPMVLEYVPAAPAAPRRPFGQDRLGSWDAPAKRATAQSNFMKVTGLPKDIENQELVTFLRSYGVLGMAEVIVRKNLGLVRFETLQNVEAAISKADGAALKGEKLSLKGIDQFEWRALKARMDAVEDGGGAGGWDPDGDQGDGRDSSGFEWGMRDWMPTLGRARLGPGAAGSGFGASGCSGCGAAWRIPAGPGRQQSTGKTHIQRPLWMTEEHVVEVSNLPPGFTSARLRKLFHVFGIDYHTGTWVEPGECVGLVAFETALEAAEALRVDGALVEEYRISVTKAPPAEASQPAKPPSQGAGLGGQKMSRSILPAGGAARVQQPSGAVSRSSSTFASRLRPQESGGGGSSSSGSGGGCRQAAVQMQAQSGGVSPGGGNAIPAAFRAQAARSSAAWKGSEDGWDSWSGSWDDLGATWGVSRGGACKGGAGKASTAGWGSQGWDGWGYGHRAAAPMWGKRSVPY
uniref:RRM domain-containing protein n=1 Tax=Pyrodinium bahamense TaxID=73915 RepID=A0A7S0B7S6_9DINO|mmetsp:Transcript_5368/g.14962  ORF Transcript_5368/g.14962 Transcript_5368/m.14962 type:complete len:539 (+) Transcript_5368:98-1714(+)